MTLAVSAGQTYFIEVADFYGVGYASGGASYITEFTFTGVGNKFRNLNGEFIAQLNPNGPPGGQFSEQAWGIMPTDKAVVDAEGRRHDAGAAAAGDDAEPVAAR